MYCWSCGAQLLSLADGVSLTGDSSPTVCCRCHDSLATRDRIALSALLRRRTSGGIGLREALASISGLCEWIRSQGIDALRAAADADMQDDDDDEDWKPE